jgi:TetR/AcrR family transcriptional regulator
MEKLSKTEEKIIQAATEVFLQKGKDGARMQEIADRAGINKALLHYYFRSKERLYEAVFVKELKKFFRGILTTIQDVDDFPTFTHSFINHYIDTISKQPRLVRFILWEIEKGGGRVSSVILDTMKESSFNSQHFLAKIRSGFAKKQIRNIDPPNFIISLIGMCLFPFIAKPVLENILIGLNVTSPDFLEKRKEEIQKLIWNGIKPEKN